MGVSAAAVRPAGSHGHSVNFCQGCLALHPSVVSCGPSVGVSATTGELSHNKAKSTLEGNRSTSTRPCYPFPVLSKERIQKGKNYKIELRSRKLEEQTL